MDKIRMSAQGIDGWGMGTTLCIGPDNEYEYSLCGIVLYGKYYCSGDTLKLVHKEVYKRITKDSIVVAKLAEYPYYQNPTHYKITRSRLVHSDHNTIIILAKD